MKATIALVAIALLVLSACGQPAQPKGPAYQAPEPVAQTETQSEPVSDVGTDLNDVGSSLDEDMVDFNGLSTDLADVENGNY